MKTNKKVKVVMLPTQKADGLFILKDKFSGQLGLGNPTLPSCHSGVPQCLYLTSKEEKIGIGDWYTCGTHITKCEGDVSHVKTGFRKIIATNDMYLCKRECYKCRGKKILYPVYHDGSPIDCMTCNGTGEINDVPGIPESFVKAFVNAKGNIYEVKVEYEDGIQNIDTGHRDEKLRIRHPFIITREDNTVIIHRLNNKLLDDFYNFVLNDYEQNNLINTAALSDAIDKFENK